jgi:GNAT superfamily N-acetyltransferase
MTTTIRPAKDQDAAALAALSGQLGYPSSPADILSRLQQIRPLPDHAILVAERDGAVSGWLHVQTRRSLETPEYGEITALVVDERLRGQGVGAELVAAAATWASRQGLPVLRVRSNVVRERTHSFYEKLGFSLSKSQKVFAKDLPRGNK